MGRRIDFRCTRHYVRGRLQRLFRVISSLQRELSYSSLLFFRFSQPCLVHFPSLNFSLKFAKKDIKGSRVVSLSLSLFICRRRQHQTKFSYCRLFLSRWENYHDISVSLGSCFSCKDLLYQSSSLRERLCFSDCQEKKLFSKFILLICRFHPPGVALLQGVAQSVVPCDAVTMTHRSRVD